MKALPFFVARPKISTVPTIPATRVSKPVMLTISNSLRLYTHGLVHALSSRTIFHDWNFKL